MNLKLFIPVPTALNANIPKHNYSGTEAPLYTKHFVI